MSTVRNVLDQGSTDFYFADQKGRPCGYAWIITQVIFDRPTSFGSQMGGWQLSLAAGEPIVELRSSPTRNGHHYGPAHHNMFRTLEEARQVAVKRAEASRKRDAKKFLKADCDCCGKSAILSRCTVSGIETFACDKCRNWSR